MKRLIKVLTILCLVCGLIASIVFYGTEIAVKNINKKRDIENFNTNLLTDNPYEITDNVFEYDNEKNPFRGFLGLYFDELILAHGNFASKNNVTKIIITEDYKGSTATDTEIISYTYDGIFPATRSYDGSTEYFEYE